MDTRERPLPWRGERDPYRILVSEVMLQQTQAFRVVPHYERFLETFPTVATLAGADPADVLREWSTLGYPRRALNLWRAAQLIVERDAFPCTVDDLLTLPGIGPYTARAIASFAFDVDVAAVDANVKRVVSRFHGVTGDVQSLADSLVPRRRAAAWNQAMIDLGAEVCTARSPRCDRCPVADGCAWRRGVRPEPKPKKRHVRFQDTSRFARGRVVAALRASSSASLAQLVKVTGLDPHRTADAVASLEADGLVHRRGRLYGLGPAVRARPSGRAVAASQRR